MTKKIATFDSREAVQYCSPRRKPWVCGKWPSPGRGEKNVSHLRQCPVARHLQHPPTPPVDQTRIPCRPLRLSRRHHSRDEWNGSHHQRDRRSRSHAHPNPPITGTRRDCADRKNKFIALGSRTLCELRLANRIRSLQRERI